MWELLGLLNGAGRLLGAAKATKSIGNVIYNNRKEAREQREAERKAREEEKHIEEVCNRSFVISVFVYAIAFVFVKLALFWWPNWGILWIALFFLVHIDGHFKMYKRLSWKYHKAVLFRESMLTIALAVAIAYAWWVR